MAVKKALVVNSDGTIEQLQAGDTLAGAGGSLVLTEVEIDFGTVGNPGVYDKTFTVTDAGVSASSKIVVVASGNVATGRVEGDNLWDSITYSALAGTGQFTLYASVTPGPVIGKRKIYYTIS